MGNVDREETERLREIERNRQDKEKERQSFLYYVVKVKYMARPDINSTIGDKVVSFKVSFTNKQHDNHFHNQHTFHFPFVSDLLSHSILSGLTQ